MTQTAARTTKRLFYSLIWQSPFTWISPDVQMHWFITQRLLFKHWASITQAPFMGTSGRHTRTWLGRQVSEKDPNNQERRVCQMTERWDRIGQHSIKIAASPVPSDKRDKRLVFYFSNKNLLQFSSFSSSPAGQSRSLSHSHADGIHFPLPQRNDFVGQTSSETTKKPLMG